jgi:DNA-binding beta-propeller fold protein YncE
MISGGVGQTDLSTPISLDETAEGGLVILEETPPRVVILDSTLQLVREAGRFTPAPSLMNSPRIIRSGFGLTFNVADLNGAILVYDTRLRFIDSFEPVYEASGVGRGSPSGLAISAFGDTYIADRDNDVVFKFDLSGKFVRTIGGADAGAGRLTRPEGLAIVADGSLVVCDTDARRVVVFDRDGEYLGTMGDGDLEAPGCVAVTPDEKAVFVGDRQNGALDLYSLTGEWLASWDRAELGFPGNGGISDLLVTNMYLYVVVQEDNRIAKIRLIPRGSE